MSSQFTVFRGLQERWTTFIFSVNLNECCMFDFNSATPVLTKSRLLRYVRLHIWWAVRNSSFNFPVLFPTAFWPCRRRWPPLTVSGSVNWITAGGGSSITHPPAGDFRVIGWKERGWLTAWEQPADRCPLPLPPILPHYSDRCQPIDKQLCAGKATPTSASSLSFWARRHFYRATVNAYARSFYRNLSVCMSVRPSIACRTVQLTKWNILLLKFNTM